MDRVEEQAKLITELRTGVVAGATSAKQAEQSGATTRDILRMKKELDAMKAEMAMRNMEQEADKRKRMDIDESVEEGVTKEVTETMKGGVYFNTEQMEKVKVATRVIVRALARKKAYKLARQIVDERKKLKALMKEDESNTNPPSIHGNSASDDGESSSSSNKSVLDDPLSP